MQRNRWYNIVLRNVKEFYFWKLCESLLCVKTNQYLRF
nr:MAG TPA: hypothetical protein [Caudoviricetes sp.]